MKHRVCGCYVRRLAHPAPMTAPARFALLAFVLVLSGCDSGNPPAVPAQPSIVGTWAIQSRVQNTYATLEQTQRALDFFSPVGGELVVSGAVSASLRYLEARYSDPVGDGSLRGYSFRNVPAASGQRPLVTFGVTDTGSAVVSETRADGSMHGFYVEDPPNTALFSLGADTVRVARARYVESGTGAEVFVSGVLVLPHRTIPGGAETLVRSQAPSFDLDDQRLTFNADGTFRATFGNSTSTGRWAAVGDGTFTSLIDGVSADLTSRYTLQESVLTATTPVGPCDAVCLFFVQKDLALPAGAVRDARLTSVATFDRVQP